METRKEIAAEKKRCGSHNCTQAVVCTYYDYTGMDEETLKNVGNAFAAGMGNMEGTCGALVGAGMVLGLTTKDKAKSVKAMRQIMTQFQQRNGATQCKLLKGVGTGKILRRALKKVPNFKLHSLFLNFNSCPRSISSFKSEILFWTGI